MASETIENGEGIIEDLLTVERRKSYILKLLKGNSLSTIVLEGDTGTGKTRTAREISECAISEGLCYATLWISVTKEYEEGVLKEAIGHQILSHSSNPEECEDEEEDAEDKKKQAKKETTDQMVQKKLKDAGKKEASPGKPEEKKDASPGKTKDLLLVVDEVTSEMNENKLWKKVLQNFKKVLPSINSNDMITVITTRKFEEEAAINQQGGTEIEVSLVAPCKVFKFGNLSLDGSLDLMLKIVQKDVSDAQKNLFKDIAQKGKHLPAVIAMIAEALKYSAGQDSGLERALKKAANYEIAADGVNPLIYCAYETLPDDTDLRKCFWHSIQCFRKYYGGIHYNLLITHWILEGYFDHFGHIEKAYQRGHYVLMELIDRRFLKIREDNIIVAEGAALNMIDSRREGFGGTSKLGLASVSENDEKKVLEIDRRKVPETDGRKILGRITVMDGMIKTICNPKNWQKVSSLLIDGSRLSREVHETFFDPMKELQVLVIFNPRFKSLISSTPKPEKLLFHPEKLRVLVLRSCNILNNITHIEKLKTLLVLEISGASSLEKPPYDLFDAMSQLQSLNLSGCQMKSLPSISKLSKLRFLILRGCSSLEKLPSLKELRDLEVIDLSDATSLSSFPEQDLSNHPYLQMIDLSRTQVTRLPKFLNLKHLSRILLRGCDKVRTIPSFKHLDKLQILDLSGTKFSNFHRGSKKSEDSTTQKLPFVPCNLSELYLSHCSELKQLPSTAALEKLELLDLSNTKLEGLSSLSNLNNLRRLLLKNCSVLKKLPEMKGLDKLEVLDLSGCSNLVELPILKDFPKLEVLNISKSGMEVRQDEISELTSLKVIKDVDEEEIDRQAKDVNKGQFSILVNDTEIFQRLKDKSGLNEACIKQISHPLCPPNELARDGDNHYNSDQVMFSDFYLRTKSFSGKDSKFLEIRGLKSFTDGLRTILEDAEYISLIENLFIKSLSSAGNLTKVKCCWIARCLEMESIFCEQKDVELGEKLEILWVSNLPKLKSLFSEKLQFMVDFENLTHLHLDCCRNLKYVFSQTQIPEKLEVLEIKFCDSLEMVFKPSEDGPEECPLPNLQTLLLFELPKLTSIGFTVPNPKIWECPNLKSPKPTIKVVDGHLKFRPNEEVITDA